MGLGWRLQCPKKYVVFRGLTVLQRSCPCLKFFHKLKDVPAKNHSRRSCLSTGEWLPVPWPVFCHLQDSKVTRELAAWHCLPPTEVCLWVPQLPLLTLLHAIGNLLTTDLWRSCCSLLSPEISLNPRMAASASRTAHLISCWLQPGIICVPENCCHIVAVAAFTFLDLVQIMK